MSHRMGAVAVAAIVLVALVSGTALADTPGAPVTPVFTTVRVAGGAGDQGFPHVSGPLVTYYVQGATTVRVHYQDLASGVDAAIPGSDDEVDAVNDVSGSVVVFQRADRLSDRHSIMAFDTAAPAAGAVELAPGAVTFPWSLGIGGRTVSWMQSPGPTSVFNEMDVFAYDLDTHAVTALTSDDATSAARYPAVSEDGGVITWSKCDNTSDSCAVWRSVRGAGGTWGAPVQLTGSSREGFALPDTNGQVVVWNSDASEDWNIEWQDVAGTNPHELVMPGYQRRPRISGSLVLFEQTETFGGNADLLAYDIATGRLYRLTDSPMVNERLSDISVSADGTARVVFEGPDALGASADVYAMTFRIASGPAYDVCPLFDQAKSHRLGSVVPTRLRLCDADGANLSSASRTLTATGLVKKDGSASTAVVEDAGNANPDSAFRYDETLAGYVYNLSTRGLSAGTWELRFTVSGDPTTYGITFDLR